jgi:HTH-type transcriptional regulator, sugar sensing transcriptional regulator
MEDLVKKLQEAGLSNKEAEVYLVLLKHGPIGGGELAKILNMDRTHIYGLLRNLIHKGLVSHIEKAKKKMFQSTSIKNLFNEVEKRRDIVSSIIPKLKKLEKTKLNPSTVRILEGKEGLRAGIRMLLESTSKDILVYGATGKSYEVLEYEMPHVAKKMEKLKMKGRFITSKKLKGHHFTRLSNIKVRYVEELTPSSTIIFDNKVILNVFDEKPFLILIESQSVSDSYRKHFEHLWNSAEA